MLLPEILPTTLRLTMASLERKKSGLTLLLDLQVLLELPESPDQRALLALQVVKEFPETLAPQELLELLVPPELMAKMVRSPPT